MKKLWEFWIRVYQRTLGGQEKSSPREVAPLPLSPFFLCRGEGAVHVGQKNLTKNPQKRGEKNIGNLGPNQAQNSTTLSMML